MSTNQPIQLDTPPKKSCFVIMPITDLPGYEPGHFSRVYEHVLVPAIEKAGYKAVRADEVKKTNLIVADILRKIVDAELLLCDVSGRNPNVLFELGIAQAFNKRVCLIKDDKTDRIFDIQGLRDTPYDATLRIDGVKKAVAEICDALTATSKPEEHDHISLITLLGVKPAALPSTTQLGNDASVLLKAIEDVGSRVAKLEKTRHRNTVAPEAAVEFPDPRLFPSPDEMQQIENYLRTEKSRMGISALEISELLEAVPKKPSDRLRGATAG